MAYWRNDGLERLSIIHDGDDYDMTYRFRREFLDPETLDIVDVIVSDEVYEGNTVIKLFFDYGLNPEEYGIRLTRLTRKGGR